MDKIGVMRRLAGMGQQVGERLVPLLCGLQQWKAGFHFLCGIRLRRSSDG